MASEADSDYAKTFHQAFLDQCVEKTLKAKIEELEKEVGFANRRTTNREDEMNRQAWKCAAAEDALKRLRGEKPDHVAGLCIKELELLDQKRVDALHEALYSCGGKCEGFFEEIEEVKKLKKHIKTGDVMTLSDYDEEKDMDRTCQAYLVLEMQGPGRTRSSTTLYCSLPVGHGGFHVCLGDTGGKVPYLLTWHNTGQEVVGQ